MTLNIRILRCSRWLFIFLVSLMVTLRTECLFPLDAYMVSYPTQSKNLERTLLKMRTVPFGKSFTWLLSISGRLLSVKNPSFFNQELLNPTDIGNLLFFCNFLKLKTPTIIWWNYQYYYKTLWKRSSIEVALEFSQYIFPYLIRSKAPSF